MLGNERLPFVGRQRELAEIGKRLGAAQAGRGGLVFVAGEPGIGKSRLLQEIAFRALSQEWEVLSGRAYDSDAVPPYLPLADALRDYVRRAAPDVLRSQLDAGAADVARVVNDLGRRLPELVSPRSDAPPNAERESDFERYRLIDALSQFVLAIAANAPGPGVLLVLDDLHWADASTLLFLQHLAHRLGNSRLLLTAGYRTVELNRTHPLSALLADLRREGLSDRLLLTPLESSQVGPLVESLTGHVASNSLVEMIVRRTDGNPFFVRELAFHLRDQGLLSATTVDEAGTWSVPEGVREVIDRRLVRLASATNRMLDAAAVLGDELHTTALQSMLGDADLVDQLEEAVAAGILRETQDRYAFEHALIRETIYSKLSLVRRQRLHLLAANTLATARTASFGLIAEHYRLAGPLADPDKACSAAMRAGEEAFSVFAYEQALAHWNDALKLLRQQQADTMQCVALLERMAFLASTIGFDHYAESVGYWREALELCERNGLPARAAYIQCRLGVLYASNTPTMDIHSAVAHLRSAEATLTLQPDAESQAHLFAGLGSAAVWGAHTVDGLAASERGMALADELRNRPLWAYSAINYGWHQVSVGALESGFDLLERAWQSADRLDRTAEAYRATSWAGVRYFLLDDPLAASACYERELAKPRLAAAPTRRLALISSMAATNARTGQLASARELASEIGAHTFPQDSGMLAQALIAFWGGDWEAAATQWARVRERYQRVGNQWGVADFDCWLAELSYVQGDTDQATRLFNEALSIAVEAPIAPVELKARTALAMLSIDRGALVDAGLHIQRCHAIVANGEDWRGLRSRLALAEGVLYAAQGNALDASAAFDIAIDIARQYSLAWDEANALMHRAHALPHQHESHAALVKSVDIYTRCGAGAVWIKRALQGQTAAKKRRIQPDGLSDRELEVVRLIAAGKTNREIAQALTISRNTVERHINHILVKTGASNRTQVATYAHRRSLIAE